MKLLPKRLLAVLLGALCPLFLWAQTPAHFKIGEKELKDIQIYSILQSSNEQLYLSSDEGIYLNSRGVFIPLEAEDVLAKLSLFGLTEYKGSIYCHNLAGQIFIIENNRLSLFTSIPDKYVSNRIQLFVDNYDQLIFFSKGNCLQINEDKTFELIADNKHDKHLGAQLSILHDGRMLFSTTKEGSYQELDKNEIIDKAYSNSEGKAQNPSFRSFFTLDNRLVIASHKEFKYANESGVFRLSGTYKNRFYPIAPNEVWGLKSDKGISVFRSNSGRIEITQTYFKDYFISCFHKSPDGSIYLGTFNRGIIVIPNLSVFTKYSAKRNGQIKDFAISSKNQLFFSEAGKGILSFQDTLILIEKESDEYFNSLYWLEGADFGINKKYPELYHEDYSSANGMIPIPTAQKILKVGTETYIMATSKGIIKKGPGSVFEHINWNKYRVSPDLSSLNTSKVRIKAVGVDSKNKLIYASSLKGTLYLDTTSNWIPILYNGSKIICNEIVILDGLVWFATVSKGILVYDNQKLVQEIKFSDGRKNNQVKQLFIKDSIIYALNDNHLKLINQRNNSIKTIGVAEGVSGDVNKFEIKDSIVWMLIDNAQILYTDLNFLLGETNIPSIYIDSIANKGKKINLSQTSFSFNKNEFTFYVDNKNPVFGDEVVIKYRIKGFEDEWNEHKGKLQKISYKFMPDGEYIFQVFSQYHESQSKIKSYSFIISPPYWQTWWFYTLSIALIGSIVVLIFRYRIRNIRKRQVEEIRKQQLKAEVIEAELRALRSQMNPHFIFNSLQSIQALILTSELERSYDYLVIFSKMVRKVLHYSNEKFISISSELEFLDLYLKLEELRFEDDFEYSIAYDGEDDILVPSLIIQPFIENALVHGLHHRKENKRLSIKLTLKENLHCEIIDNGIGREASKEIQDRQGNQHQSFAIDAIEKRLEMFTQDSDAEIGFKITDLYEGAESQGTKVDIYLPIRRNY